MSTCKFLQKQERKYMTKSRQVKEAPSTNEESLQGASLTESESEEEEVVIPAPKKKKKKRLQSEG